MVDYEIGYLAQKTGFGQCTESREGEMKSINEFNDYDVTLKYDDKGFVNQYIIEDLS